MTTAPPEHPGGQEVDPPDIRLFVLVAGRLLRDLALKPEHDPLSPDDRLRILALASVAKRLHDHLEQQP